ncbi:MAG: NAD(P)-binding protein, partial [Waddliaceae bacterium]
MKDKKKLSEMTAPPDLHTAKRVGPVRRQRPQYLDRLPPCNKACPAGENIQAWLALAMDKKYKEAWEEITKDNPMPAVHGRVCYHPCEDRCNRGELNTTISIHAVERFLGDLAIEKKWEIQVPKSTGKKALVVGAGPSGLSAAYHLRRLGHEVEIHEAGPMAGGMMHFGIPQYRLPRDILDAEIKRIETMGVTIVLNHKVENLMEEKKTGDFDAVFVAVGAHLSKRVEIPAKDAGKIVDALSLLKNVEEGEDIQLGRRVVIYGGGNTAMDAARTAKRLGVEEPIIVYRRNRDKAPAHKFEIDDVEEEGIKIHWLRTIKEITETTFTVEKMALDETGWPQPTGEVETLEADSLIMAVGQDTDTKFLKDIPSIQFKKDGTVIVNDRMMTGCDGVFAGGDMVPHERTVTVAVGHGKKAARNIEAYLKNKSYTPPKKHEDVPFDLMNLWFHTDAPQRKQSKTDISERGSSFMEVLKGLNEK